MIEVTARIHPVYTTRRNSNPGYCVRSYFHSNQKVFLVKMPTVWKTVFPSDCPYSTPFFRQTRLTTIPLLIPKCPMVSMIVEHISVLDTSLRRLSHYQPFHVTSYHNYGRSVIVYS